jgi:hypothetical protein
MTPCEQSALNLQFTERTRVYEEIPATLSEVKVGDKVMLDLRVVDRKFVTKGIDILPPFESGAKSTRQPGEPPPADTLRK